ncbi:hypothetical protein VDGL01_07734 [Verticillium dahliae]
MVHPVVQPPLLVAIRLPPHSSIPPQRTPCLVWHINAEAMPPHGCRSESEDTSTTFVVCVLYNPRRTAPPMQPHDRPLELERSLPAFLSASQRAAGHAPTNSLPGPSAQALGS